MYKILKLFEYPKLIHAISTVDEGNMSFRFGSGSKVIESREKFLSKLEISIKDCVAMYVVHRDEIVVVNKSFKGRGMRNIDSAVRVDGLLTNEKGVYLFLLVADCLPIILYDPVKGVVGLVHAGWRGVDINIVGRAIEKLGDQYGVEPSNVIAGLGPAALKDSFIKESPEQIGDPKWKGFVEDVGDNKYEVDFVGLCKKQLIELGVKKKNILESEIDTVKDKRFFSHYRNSGKDISKQGRFACVVGLR